MKRCRTMLFIPGNNPGMLAGAGALGADIVIFDLEDAVAQSEKDAARILVRRTLTDLRPERARCAVRINSLDTPHWQEDILAVVAGKADILLLPKCERPEDLHEVRAACVAAPGGHVPVLMALIETTRGMENLKAITSGPVRPAGALLGAEDLTAELGARRTAEGKEILYARSRLVMACKAAGVKAIDTPFPFVTDLEGLERDADLAAQLGFDGKAVISPHHVHAVKQAFSPTQTQLDWALRVMHTAEQARKEGKGAVSLDGMMIDLPIIKRAERILAMAEE